MHSPLSDGERVLDEATRELAAADVTLQHAAEWVSVSRYARIYGVDRATVYKWLREDGILETYRVRSLRRIRNVPPRDKCA